MWQMKTEVIPVFVGALGTIKKGMVENIKRVSETANVTETQKISMLGSARTVSYTHLTLPTICSV